MGVQVPPSAPFFSVTYGIGEVTDAYSIPTTVPETVPTVI